jgi:hypothetical protein
MKNRVDNHECIYDSLERIPFLKNFTGIRESTLFSIHKINKYMGYEHITIHDTMTSASINMVLQEAEKRGDI